MKILGGRSKYLSASRLRDVRRGRREESARANLRLLRNRSEPMLFGCVFPRLIFLWIFP
jgi:hypothetical protein